MSVNNKKEIMMQKKAFSLVELIISVILLGIIVTFLYSTVSNLEKNNKIFADNEKELRKREKVIELLYEDIFTANDLNITGFHNSVLYMQTSNSLFDIVDPYVTWLVSKEKNTLLRFESTKKFNTQNSDYFHISKVGENCETFKIYQSKQKENILIHIQFKDQKPLVFEFAKPLQPKKRPRPKNGQQGVQAPTTGAGAEGSTQAPTPTPSGNTNTPIRPEANMKVR